MWCLVGRAWVGNSGSLALSNLNGVNGFKLDGEMRDDIAVLQSVPLET